MESSTSHQQAYTTLDRSSLRNKHTEIAGNYTCSLGKCELVRLRLSDPNNMARKGRLQALSLSHKAECLVSGHREHTKTNKNKCVHGCSNVTEDTWRTMTNDKIRQGKQCQEFKVSSINYHDGSRQQVHDDFCPTTCVYKTFHGKELPSRMPQPHLDIKILYSAPVRHFISLV